jgi:hypothetical protein
MIQFAQWKRLDRISPAQEGRGTRAEMNIRPSMTRTKRALLTPVILFLLAINLAGAEIKPEARSFTAFWVQFRTAVAKNDKEAIAEMTKLPFVYGTSKPLSKADFIKECSALFDQKTRKCFSKAKPIKEDDRDSYSVFCGEEIFVFAKVNGEYRFTDIGMND